MKREAPSQVLGTKGRGASYERWILSLWLIKISATVAGITTIAAPATRLNKKLASEGVIELQPFLIFFILILIVRLPLEKSAHHHF